MRHSLITKTAICACLLLPVLAWARAFTGEVVRVLDGDTVEVLVNRKPVRVRLAEVDCPEKRQPFGNRAKQFTSEFAFGKTVQVDIRDKDRYGRVVGVVILPDGRSLNRELVASGLAWWYRRYSRDASLGRLEAEARAGKRGLWADPHPVEPSKFRHKRKR